MGLGGRGRDERGQLVGEVHGGAGLLVVGAAVGGELAEGIGDGEEINSVASIINDKSLIIELELPCS